MHVDPREAVAEGEKLGYESLQTVAHPTCVCDNKSALSQAVLDDATLGLTKQPRQDEWEDDVDYSIEQ